MHSTFFFLRKKHGSKMAARFLVYFFGFFWSLGVALPLYIQSSYAEQFMSVSAIGLYWAIINALTVLAIMAFPPLIAAWGNYRTTVWVAVLLFASSIALGMVGFAPLVIAMLGIHYVAWNLLTINNDVLLENIADGGNTGGVRTMFLTLYNLAIALSPLLMGYLSASDGYALVYLAGGFITIPAILLLFLMRRSLGKEGRYRSRHLTELFATFITHHNLANIFKVAFVLRFFYCIMVLYSPIYLHEHVGFSWEQIGVMFAIMLTPFVLFELPAGVLADRFWGEKEMLTLGLAIMAITTGSLYFLRSDSMMVWTIMLFLSRVGAALVESMQDVYFFKIVSRRDMDLINLFRDLNPASWLIGSLVAFVALSIAPMRVLFLILALVVVWGLRPALRLQDTK